MRDRFHIPPQEREPTYERPFLEAPAPSFLDPAPSRADSEDHDEEEERERVIIIEI
jgi:hypothetical protein